MTNAELHGCPYPGWVCFHCGEEFQTVGAAADHFGAAPNRKPACQIKLGEERGLVMELRRVEAERDALAAHVERVLQAWNAEQDGRELFSDAWINYVGDVIEDAPTTSLAQLKAEWQADVLRRMLTHAQQVSDKRLVDTLEEFIVDELRRQAKGGDS